MAREQIQSVEIRKVYANQDGTAVIICPHCGTGKTVNVAKFMGQKARLKLRCKCQSSFLVSLEFRNPHRKEVGRLAGSYSKLPARKEWSRMLVTDISLKGIQFTALSMHDLRKGDEVTVKFNLDDSNQSEIKQNAAVKWVKDKCVGCEFTDLNPHEYNKALGFYVMP